MTGISHPDVFSSFFSALTRKCKHRIWVLCCDSKLSCKSGTLGTSDQFIPKRGFRLFNGSENDKFHIWNNVILPSASLMLTDDAKSYQHANVSISCSNGYLNTNGLAVVLIASSFLRIFGFFCFFGKVYCFSRHHCMSVLEYEHQIGPFGCVMSTFGQFKPMKVTLFKCHLLDWNWFHSWLDNFWFWMLSNPKLKKKKIILELCIVQANWNLRGLKKKMKSNAYFIPLTRTNVKFKTWHRKRGKIEPELVCDNMNTKRTP